jgi:flagellum-specific ATP synthase
MRPALDAGAAAPPADLRPFTLERYSRLLPAIDTMPIVGRVIRTVGVLIESAGPRVPVGAMCEVGGVGGPGLPVEVVGFRDHVVLSVPLGDTAGIRSGDPVVARGRAASVGVGPELLGRVIDALGRPLDGRPLSVERRYPTQPPPLNPMDRDPVAAPIATGVRVIDALLACGRGQRLGLFGGSGVGKSTLLGMLTRGTAADVIVLGLVGERGRELRGFLDHDLGAEGLARAVVVVSTSDNPPLLRMRAAHTATAVAEYFRDQGRHVLLLMDSVTRFATAQREVGLAAGEPPTTKGYPPSVFAALPALLERAGGVRGRGSITAMYTVLVDGDDHNEPIADAVRSILDGHVVLSRDLAARNHYPAIDVLQSVSRTMPDVTSVGHRAGWARAAVAGRYSRFRRPRERGRLRRRIQPAHRRGARQARRDRGVSLSARRHRVWDGRRNDSAGGAGIMKQRFTFRAQAALDLRRREHDARRRELASAQWEVRTARQQLADAARMLADARRDAGDAMRRVFDAEALRWHQLWIARLARARAAHEVAVAEKEAAGVRAAVACETARQRADAMERLKEKALGAWREAARLHEQREFDALATMRHVHVSRQNA